PQSVNASCTLRDVATQRNASDGNSRRIQSRKRAPEAIGRCSAGGKAAMTYDVTIITVRPGTHPDALLRLQQHASEAAPAGVILACWDFGLGALTPKLAL